MLAAVSQQVSILETATIEQNCSLRVTTCGEPIELEKCVQFRELALGYRCLEDSIFPVIVCVEVTLNKGLWFQLAV